MQVIDRAAQGTYPYPLGNSSAETQRLIFQSSFYNTYTRELFEEAGIRSGMRVLDVGSGAGDVALIAAEMVGSAGEVIGIDRNPDVLEVARQRAARASLTNIAFLQGDVSEPNSGEPSPMFDAIVGRLVLLYQPDPVAAVSRLCARLRPGGIVAFQEFNVPVEALRSYPSTPLWDQFANWAISAFDAASADVRMGAKLVGTYQAAGLRTPRIHAAAPVGGGPDWGGYRLAAEVVRSLLPVMVRFNIATEAEVDIETLESRLRTEACGAHSTLHLPELISAWSTVE